MDTEDFVTYKQALALKKLGFIDDCLYFYELCKTPIPNSYDSGVEKVFVNKLLESKNEKYPAIEGICDAPTLSQAQKWLRKEKNLYVCSEIDITNKEYNKYFWTIYSLPSKQQTYVSKIYNSPEEALSEGIDAALELLTKKFNNK